MTIHIGDCRDVLATLPADSVDAVVTDPPYGIGFMGREWDTFSPESVAKLAERRRRKGTERTSASYPGKMSKTSQGGGVQVQYDERPAGNARFQAWCAEWLAECLRVLKPGAPLMVFGGVRTYHRLTCAVEDVGFEIKDCLMWLHGNGFPKHRTLLKPAWEPIVVAKKPGKGGLNIEDGRIPMAADDRADRIARNGTSLQNISGYGNETWGERDFANALHPSGRWPANVALDEAAAAALDAQTGERPSRAGQTKGVRVRGIYGPDTEPFGEDTDPGYGSDSGGASRFYYVAKADRAERGEGNTHPTVKPLSLMRWLVRLACPAGGTILDPFGGSGTTAVACVYEERGWILIEREPQYVEIIERRTKNAIGPLFAEIA